jgi:hypothetical protein
MQSRGPRAHALGYYLPPRWGEDRETEWEAGQKNDAVFGTTENPNPRV